MEDENELYGLESDYLPEEEEAVDTVAQSPLSIVRQRVLDTITKSEEEARGYQDTLNRIEEAKQRLLAAPDKRQVLQGFVSKLTAPKAQDDPRFYERRNLFTFLRDVGEYGQEQKLAEQEREAKRVMLQEMQAKYGMEQAEKRRSRAEQLAAQYLSKEPTEKDTRTQDAKNAAEMGLTLKEYLEFKASLTKKPEGDGPGGEAAQFLWAENTLADPKASEAAKNAARRLLEKKTPFDVRRTAMAKDKNSTTFLSRIKQQTEFTIPLINEAIDQARKGGALATGNLSKWVEGKPWIGQAATNLEKTLDSIRSNLGFDKLEELKKLSPYGASGLGAVSNAEQVLLQSVKGSVARDQSEDNLVRNLERIRNFYEKEVFQILERETGMRGITDIDEAIAEFESKIQGGESSPPAPSSGGGKSPAEMAADELRRRRKKAEGG
jgi:replicative superfamily II helicase